MITILNGKLYSGICSIEIYKDGYMSLKDESDGIIHSIKLSEYKQHICIMEDE